MSSTSPCRTPCSQVLSGRERKRETERERKRERGSGVLGYIQSLSRSSSTDIDQNYFPSGDQWPTQQTPGHLELFWTAYVWREGRGVEKIKTVQDLFYPEGKEGRFLKNQPSSPWGGGCGWVGPLWANRPAGWSPTECDVVETATVLKSSLPGPEVGVAWPVQQWRDFVSDMLGISAPSRVLCQDSRLSPLHPWILLAPEVPAFLGQRPQRERERER